MDILTRGGDGSPISKIRTLIEKFDEKYDGQLANINERLAGLQGQWDADRARIKMLEEDRARNPTRSYISPHAAREEQRREVCKWLVDNYKSKSPWAQTDDGAQWRAEQVGDVAGDGGYLVPVPLLPEVIRIVQEFGVARRICRTVPMQREKLDLTKKATGPVAKWQGSQGTLGQRSKATFTNGQLEAETMLVLDEIALQVEDDAVVDMASYLIDLFGEAVAQEEDAQAFNSTSPFTGLLQTSNVAAQAIASTSFSGNLRYDDFVKTMFKANAFVARKGTWLMSTDVFAQVMLIKNVNGDPLFNMANPGNLSAGQPGTILGRPIEISEVMPKLADDGTGKPICAYGDFRFLLIGDRRKLSIDFSDTAGASFENATRLMRVMERVAFVTALPAAFAIMKCA